MIIKIGNCSYEIHVHVEMWFTNEHIVIFHVYMYLNINLYKHKIFSLKNVNNQEKCSCINVL